MALINVRLMADLERGSLVTLVLVLTAMDTGRGRCAYAGRYCSI